MARLVAVAVLLMLAAACSGSHGGSANAANSTARARQGQPAPNWTQKTSTGSTLSLASLRGKAVYLNFFATWCPPCNQEAPYINALQKQYAPRGLQIVGVDELESAKKAAEFKAKYGLVYPAIVDDGTLQAQYEINGLPVHVFIDRSGVIHQIVVGEMSRSEIETAIKALL